MSQAAARHSQGGISQVVEALVAADGTAGHAHAANVRSGIGRDAVLTLADLADAAHYLCLDRKSVV